MAGLETILVIFIINILIKGNTMVSLETPVCNFGEPAVDFALPGVDGNVWTLQDCKGENGSLTPMSMV